MKLELLDTCCGYGKKVIVKDLSMEVSSGEALCLLGPNGVGKTTLFRTILGFLKLIKGNILIDGRNIYAYSPKELAKIIGYVPQAHNPPFPFKVIDVVIMGRTAYIGSFSSPGREDYRIAEEVLETLNIFYLRDKIYTEISGGEKQLVLIGRALAQEPKLLIMDEPTSNLDFGNQIRVLSHIDKLVKEKGIGLVMTSHFPNHVFFCASKVVFIKDGKLYDMGKPETVINEKSIFDIYGIESKIAKIEVNNKYLNFCVPVIN